MKLREIMNQISTLGGQIQAKSAELARDALDRTIPLDEIEKRQAEVTDMQKRMAALQDSYRSVQAGTENRLNPIKPEEKKEEKKTMNEIRKSNEYARAFAYAMKHGLNARNGMGNENIKVLYDALTEEGGSPAGTDGGFLVPEDMDHEIRELKRQLNPLSALFNVENVTSFTGWRVHDTAPTSGMTLVNNGKDNIHHRDQHRASHIQQKQLPMGLKIGHKAAHNALLFLQHLTSFLKDSNNIV